MMWWPYGAAMGWWMIAWTVIFWGGLIALIAWGIIKLSRHGDSTLKHDPLSIAKERYVKGEISREEFERLKKDLY